MPANRRSVSAPVSARRDWLTVAGAAEYLSVTTRTLRSWIALGKVPAYRNGRMIRVDRADLDALLLPVRGGAE